MPFNSGGTGVPMTSNPVPVRTFRRQANQAANVVISGVTKDSGGAALGGCTVKLFNRATDTKEQETVSDGSGNYAFTVDRTQTYYVVAYLPGSPDVAGTTVNTLAGI